MSKKSKKQTKHTISPDSATMGLSSTAPIVLQQTPHQRRALVAIAQMKAQLPQARGSVVSLFLLHYFTCETLAKVLQGAKKKQAPAKALSGKVDLRGLNPALKQFGLKLSKSTLERIFGAFNVRVQARPARKLRDKIVHEMSADDIAEVQKRGPRLTADMKRFIASVEPAAGQNLTF